MKLFITLVVAFLFAVWARPAPGARAEAQGPFGSNTQPVTGTTSDLWAYSNSPVFGVNAVTLQSGVPTAASTPGKTITIGAGWVRAGKFYPGPCYGAALIPKGTAHQWVTSSSGTAFAAANFLPPSIISPLNRVRADASTAAPGESAASEAIDPGIISPGSHAIAPNMELIELEIDMLGDYAAAELVARDSTSVTPIYSLVMIAQDQLLNSADLDIKFTYDPNRLILDSGYSPASIEAALRSKFTFAGGTATYDNSSSLFPPLFSGTYLVSQSDVEFADGAFAAAASAGVPEPASLALLLPAGLLALRRRR